MTSNPSPESAQPVFQPLPPRPKLTTQILHWVWRLLACNPFYIGSAALLLYSMRCLSLDATVFKDEAAQMFFNVSSFHFYELLLVGTAIFLARRKIWYDSGLLVGLENLFMFVPFILVSQALLLDDWFAFELCLAGSVLAGVRVRALRRFIASVNLPARLMFIGALLLGLNLGLPVLTRLLHKAVTVPIWDYRGAILIAVEWFFMVPVVVALALLLPSKTTSETGSFYSRRWFPLLALMLWLGGTGTHLYCIGYVYGIPWRISLVAPAVWTAAWVLWKRRADLDFLPASFQKDLDYVLLLVPQLALIMAGWDNNWRMFAVLAGLNMVAYGTLTATWRDATTFHLCLASLALTLCSLPREWLTMLHFDLNLPEVTWASLLTYAVFSSLFSRNPKYGVLGALSIPLWISLLVYRFDETTFHFAEQAGFIFFLLHSLRWDDGKHAGTKFARIMAGSMWVFNSGNWMASDPVTGALATFLCGVSVLAVYFAARLVFGIWGPRMVPYMALAVMVLPVCGIIWKLLLAAPAGVLYLLTSFGLFAVGTVAALARVRWNSRQPLAEVVVKQSEAMI